MSQFITLNTILGNGKSYKVPLYQRDYSWREDDWEDLWLDIEDIPNEKSHYLGYIVLQKIDDIDDGYWVIDGQQRLTTLSLLALAVTALFNDWANEGIDADKNKIRLDKITERYLGNFSTSELTLSPKLTLNRNNDDYYKSWLLKFRKPIAISKLKTTEQLMQKAFNYYFDRLNEKFKDNKSGAELAEFLEKIVGTGITFTQIIVANDLDAYKVFETLNARGVKLSTADLLKNYLFKLTSDLSQLDLEEAERRWQNINDVIRTNDLTDFIRHYWNSTHKIERQATLFKAIKRETNTPKSAFEFLHQLENISQYYTAFNNPYDNLWDQDISVSLKILKILRVTTCYSLMMAAILHLEQTEIKKLFREISVITLRYNIAGLNPNEAERVFSKVANDISNKKITDARSAADALKSIYVSDKNFAQAFSTAVVNTKRKRELVKYLLVKIENQLAEKDYQPEDATSTIEHILPENPGSIWQEDFPNEIQDNYIYRLGNYSLLESSVNKKLGNEMSFLEKLPYYTQSAYQLSSKYCNYEKFDPGVILQRQEMMAKTAKAIWKSAYIKSLI